MSSTRNLGRGLAVVAALFAAGAFTRPASAQTLDPDQARAKELVLRIRKSMREIDSLLLKGAQPDAVERELAANQKRIEELLKETESKSQSVIESIDELIKLAKYRKNPQSQPPPPQGEGDGSQSPGGRQPKREKSKDPGELSPQPLPDSNPGKQDGQEQKQGDQKPNDPRRDGDPKSGKPDSTPPDQRDASRPPPKGPTGEFERTDTSGRWGVLPPKEAEDLQRRNADEFPQRYRQWMELYFRRVNKLPSRDH